MRARKLGSNAAQRRDEEEEEEGDVKPLRDQFAELERVSLKLVEAEREMDDEALRAVGDHPDQLQDYFEKMLCVVAVLAAVVFIAVLTWIG